MASIQKKATSNYSSLHFKVQEQHLLTMHEQERNNLKKMVQAMIKPKSVIQLPHTPELFTQFQRASRDSRNRYLNEEISAIDVDQTKNGSTLSILKTITRDDAQPEQLPNNVFSGKKPLKSQSTTLLNKINNIGEIFEEQSFFKNIQAPSKLIHEQHSSPNLIGFKTLKLKQTGTAIQSKFKPSKQIQDALNVREGENKAKVVFDSYSREREYMSRRSAGSYEHATPQKPSPYVTLENSEKDLRKQSSAALNPKDILNKLGQVKDTQQPQMKESVFRAPHHQRQLTQIDADKFRLSALPQRESSLQPSSQRTNSRSKERNLENHYCAQEQMHKSPEQQQKSLSDTKQSILVQTFLNQQTRAEPSKIVKTIDHFDEIPRNDFMGELKILSKLLKDDIRHSEDQLIKHATPNEQYIEEKSPYLQKRQSVSPLSKPPLPRQDSVQRKKKTTFQIVSSFLQSKVHDSSLDFSAPMDVSPIQKDSIFNTRDHSLLAAKRQFVTSPRASSPRQMIPTAQQPPIKEKNKQQSPRNTSIGKSLQKYMIQKLGTRRQQDATLNSTDMTLINNEHNTLSFSQQDVGVGGNLSNLLHRASFSSRFTGKDDKSIDSRQASASPSLAPQKPTPSIHKHPLITSLKKNRSRERSNTTRLKSSDVKESPRIVIPKPEAQPTLIQLDKQVFVPKVIQKSSNIARDQNSRSSVFKLLSKNKSYEQLQPYVPKRLESQSHLETYFQRKKPQVMKTERQHNFQNKSSVHKPMTFEEYKVVQMHQQHQQHLREQTKEALKKVHSQTSLEGVQKYKQKLVNFYQLKQQNETHQEITPVKGLNTSIKKINQFSGNKHNFKPNQSTVTPSRSDMNAQQITLFTSVRSSNESPNKDHYMQSTDSVSNKRRDRFQQESRKIGDIAVSIERQAKLQEVIQKSAIVTMNNSLLK